MNKGGDRYQPGPLRRVNPPMPGNYLVFSRYALQGPHKHRRQDAIFPDALGQAVHLLVVQHLVGMPLKGVEPVNRN